MPISDEVIELAPVGKAKKSLIIVLIVMGLCAAMAITFLVLYLLKPSVTEEKRIVNTVTVARSDLFVGADNGKETLYASVGNTYTVYADISVEKDTSSGVIWEWERDAVTLVSMHEGGDGEPAFFTFIPNAAAHGKTTNIKARSQANSGKSDMISFVILNQGAEYIKFTRFGTTGNMSDITDVEPDKPLVRTLPFYSTSKNNKPYTVRFEQLGKFNANTNEYSHISAMEGMDAVSVTSSDPTVIRINEGYAPTHFSFDVLKPGESTVTVTANVNNEAFESSLGRTVSRSFKITVMSNASLGYVDSYYFFNKAVVDAQFIYSCLDTNTKTTIDVNNVKKTVDDMNKADPTLGLTYSTGAELILPYNSGNYNDLFDHVMLNPVSIQYVVGSGTTTAGTIRDKWYENITVTSSNTNVVRPAKDNTTGGYKLDPRGFDSNYTTDRCMLTLTDTKDGIAGVKTEIPVRIVAQNQQATLSVAERTSDTGYGPTVTEAATPGRVSVNSVSGSTFKVSLDYSLTLIDVKDDTAVVTNNKYINDTFMLDFSSETADFDDIMEVNIGSSTDKLNVGNVYNFGKVFAIQKRSGSSSTSIYSAVADLTVKLKQNIPQGTYTLYIRKVGSEPKVNASGWLDSAWEKRVTFTVTERATRAEFVISRVGTEYIQNNKDIFINGYYTAPGAGSTKATIYVQNAPANTSFQFGDAEIMKQFISVDGSTYNMSIQTTLASDVSSILGGSAGAYIYRGGQLKNTTAQHVATVTVTVSLAGQTLQNGRLVFDIYLFDAVSHFSEIEGTKIVKYGYKTQSGTRVLEGGDEVPVNKVKASRTQQSEAQYYFDGIAVYYGGDTKNVNRKLDSAKNPSDNAETIYSYDGQELYSYNSTTKNIKPLTDIYAFSLEKRIDFSHIVLEFLLTSDDSTLLTNCGIGFNNNSSMRFEFMRLADGVAMYDSNTYDTSAALDFAGNTFTYSANQDRTVDLYVSSLINIGGEGMLVARLQDSDIAVDHAYLTVPGDFALLVDASDKADDTKNYYYHIHFLAPKVPQGGNRKVYSDFRVQYAGMTDTPNSTGFELTVQNVARGISAIELYADQYCSADKKLNSALDFGVYINDAMGKLTHTFYVKVTYVAWQEHHTYFESAIVTLPSYLSLAIGSDGSIKRLDNSSSNKYSLTSLNNIKMVYDVFACVVTLDEGNNSYSSTDKISVDQEFNGSISDSVGVTVGSGLSEIKVKANAELNTSEVTVGANGEGGLSYTFALKNASLTPSIELELEYGALANSYNIRYDYRSADKFDIVYPTVAGLVIDSTARNAKPTITVTVANNVKVLSETLTFKFIDKANGANSGNVFTVKLNISVTIDIYALDFGDSGNTYNVCTTGMSVGEQSQAVTITFNNNDQTRIPANKAVNVYIVKGGAEYKGNDVRIEKVGNSYELRVANGVVSGTGYAVRVESVKDPTIYTDREIVITTYGHDMRLAGGNTIKPTGDSATVTLDTQNKTYILAAEIVNKGTNTVVEGKKATYKLYSNAGRTTEITDGSVTVDGNGVITFKTVQPHGFVYYRATYADVDAGGSSYNEQAIDVAIEYYVDLTSVAIEGVDGNVLSGKTITLYVVNASNYSYLDLTDRITAFSSVLGGNGKVTEGVTYGVDSTSNDLIINGMRIIPRALTNNATVTVTATYNNKRVTETYTVKVDSLPLLGPGDLAVTGALDLLGGGTVIVTPAQKSIPGYTATATLIEKDTSHLTVTETADGYSITLNGASDAHFGNHTLTYKVTYTKAGYVQGELSSSVTKDITVTCNYAPAFELYCNNTKIEANGSHVMLSGATYEVRITNVTTGVAYTASSNGVVTVGAVSDGKASVTLNANQSGQFGLSVKSTVYGQEKTTTQTYTFTLGTNPVTKLYKNVGGVYTLVEDGAVAIDYTGTTGSTLKYEISNIDPTVISASNVNIVVNGNATVGAVTRDGDKYYVIITVKNTGTLSIGGTVKAGTHTVYLATTNVTLTATAPSFTLTRTGSEDGILPGATSKFTLTQTATDFMGGIATTYSIALGSAYATVNSATGVLTANTDISSDVVVTVRATVTVTGGAFAGTYTVDKDITIKGVALPTVTWNNTAATTITAGGTNNYAGKATVVALPEYGSMSAADLTAGESTLSLSDYTFSNGELIIASNSKTRAGGTITLVATVTIPAGKPHAGESVSAYLTVTVLPTLTVGGVNIANAAGSVDFNKYIGSAINVATSTDAGCVQPTDKYSVVGLEITNVSTGVDAGLFGVDGSQLLIKNNVSTGATVNVAVTVLITSGAHAGATLTGNATVTVSVPNGRQTVATSWDNANNRYNTVALDNTVFGIAAGNIEYVDVSVVSGDNANAVSVLDNRTDTPKLSVLPTANTSFASDAAAIEVGVAYTVRMTDGTVYYGTTTLSIPAVMITVTATLDDRAMQPAMQKNVDDVFVVALSADNGFDLTLGTVEVTVGNTATTSSALEAEKNGNSVKFTAKSVAASLTVTMNYTVAGKTNNCRFTVTIDATTATYYTVDNTSFIDNTKASGTKTITSDWTYSSGDYTVYKWVDYITISVSNGRLSDLFSSISAGGTAVTDLNRSSVDVYFATNNRRVEKESFTLRFVLKTDAPIDLTVVSARLISYRYQNYNTGSKTTNMQYRFRVVDDINVSFNTMATGVGPVSDMRVTYKSTYGTLPDPTRAGYELEGWYFSTAFASDEKVTETTTVDRDSDHTLYAKWTVKTYTVTLMSEGTRVGTTTVTYGGKYGMLTAPAARDGYTFGGWYTAQNGGGELITANTVVEITTDTTLYAKWTANIYTVTLMSGTDEFAKLTVTYGGKYGVLPTATLAGNRFDGWYTAQEGGTQVTADTDVTTTADQTLYARFTPNTYTVTLDINDGTTAGATWYTQTVEVGTAFTLHTLLTPTRDGYTFDGWYNGAQAAEDTITVNDDVTLTAHWTAIPTVETFTVTLNANDDTVAGATWYTQTVEVGTTFTLHNKLIPTRDGYTFDGWYNGTQAAEATITVNDDVTLTAHWTAVPQTHTVTYNTGDGAFADGEKTCTVQVVSGDMFTPDAKLVATREGYTFGGWEKNGTLVTEAFAVTDNTVLTAKWTAIPTVETFTVTLNANDDTVAGATWYTQTVEVGTTFTLHNKLIPTRDGYTFDGWYNGTQAAEDTITVNDDVTLTAHWAEVTTVTTYTLTVNFNGGTIGEATEAQFIAYGECSAHQLLTPTREGYTFNGWYTQAEGSDEKIYVTDSTVEVDRDITIYADWTENTTTPDPEENGGETGNE